MDDAQRLRCLPRGQLLLAIVFLLCGGPLHAQATGAPDFTAIPKLQEIKDRSAAPDFTLADPDGWKVSLKDFRGKVVFLNFWATWCESCREEMPSMERLYREFKGKGLEIIAVNVREKRPDALAFYRKLRLTYPVVLDSGGEVGLLYGAFGLPLTYLIDRKGIPLARLWGPADWYSPAARKLIAALVEQK
ncbi:MAG: TlpA family protein disulfide reductase [Betaproteobacteria bacterium]|nr:TlpA family protein disulfide reductase [Gammaproteobacteria bacterium]MDH3436607.1 TlpA family protein disulfide reductase [Betaproteobacteria bacterium]